MINETLEIQGLLDGTHINEKCLYRACYLLAKWHKQQGRTPIQARQEIFGWANRYGHYIKYDLNSIIHQAYKDPRRLTENLKVYISRDDIGEICGRFDKTNTRLVALAILCYAKAFANSNSTFSISLAALSEWVGINHGNLSSRYIPELINFEYIRKIATRGNFTWNKVIKSKSLDVELCVPISNHGEFELKDNDIRGLYREVFEKVC